MGIEGSDRRQNRREETVRPYELVRHWGNRREREI